MKKGIQKTTCALLNFLIRLYKPNKKIMKQLFFLLFFICAVQLGAKSQTEEEGVNLDLLKGPVSPGSSLLGIAATDVEKPTDVSAFMPSLRSATNNFTALPSTYAIDIAPYWIFKKKVGDITTAGLSNSSGKNVFKQTFVLSFAIRNTDSAEAELIPNTVYSGLGFKFSIFRGDYDSVTKASLAAIKKWQDIKLAALSKTLSDYKNDAAVIELQSKRKNLIKNAIKDFVDDTLRTVTFKNATNEEINALKKANVDRITKLVMKSPEYREIDSALDNKLLELKQATKSEADAKIKEVAAAFQTARVGLTWDVSGGVSGQFVNKRFDNAKVYNAGIWTTLGYTGEKFGSALFLLRLLYNPDKIFAKNNLPNEVGNITTLDFGGRYIYAQPQSKFNVSLEGVYRSVLSSNTIKPSWRLIFNADYAIWKNQKLTFSFGKNFNGTVTKDGNLVAALTFLTGFGNKR
jgi:hypothetical protein